MFGAALATTGALLALLPLWVSTVAGVRLIGLGAFIVVFGTVTTSGTGSGTSASGPSGAGSVVVDPGALRRWTSFKVLLFAAHGLLFLAPVLLVATWLANAFGIGNVPPMAEQGLQLVSALIVVIVAALYHSSGREAIRRPATRARTVAWVSLGLVAVLVSAAGVRAVFQDGGARVGPFHSASLLTLGAWTLLVMVAVMRDVPSPRRVFHRERAIHDGPVHLTHAKSFWMPVAIATCILAWTLPAVFLIGLGASGLAVAFHSPPFRAVIATAAVIAISSTAWASALVRRADELPVFQTGQSQVRRTQQLLITASVVPAVGFLGLMTLALTGTAVAGMSIAYGRWVEFLALAAMAAVGPFGFYFAYRERRTRLLEQRFPGFLRDLAAARRAGINLDQAIMMACRGDYGALDPEIERMAAQLSWKMPFEQVLQEFGDRVRTPLVERAVSVVKEASWTGGNIASVLDAAASDAQEIQNIHAERRVTTRVYTGIVYIGFFIFLGVAAILYVELVPQLVTAAQEVGQSGGDSAAHGFAVNPDVTLLDYRVFYFMAGVMQALGGGFVAGLMGTGQWTTGLRHMFIMVGMVVATFVWLA